MSEENEDLITRSDQLEEDIIAVRKEKVLPIGAVIASFSVFLILMISGFSVMFYSIQDVANSTNEAITNEIPNLQRTIRRLEQRIESQQEVLDDQQKVLNQFVEQNIDDERGLDQ